jgi:tRNA(fMet)-specific endonuclease VapC
VKRYMLDTNMVSHLIRQHPAVVRRVVATSMASLCVSAITAGELLFGLAKRPAATRLHLAVREFLRRVDVLAWDNTVATRYGTVRADLQNRGMSLAPIDLLIAAHALSAGAVLVTNDLAFHQVTSLDVEDWAA